uniref:Uncharacterized protein n=1 Tax=Rhodnius prolixus TaxID=13249 RepID=T1IDG2_RHOPR
MGEQKLEFSCMSEDPNVATFEAKIKEKIYELQIKRNTLSEVRTKLHQEFLEKHNLELSLEKATRECEEIRIQLDVAIKAARHGESERANNREVLARQSVQLEATVKDRNFLQEQIRNLQLENSDLQRQLDQADEKVKSHQHLQETCKIKETQWRTYFDTLQRSLESELEEMKCKKVMKMESSKQCDFE